LYSHFVTLRPVQNPPNPFLSQSVEYLEDLPPEARQAKLEVYEDHTREIVAENSSPDVGFQYSVNPYRGCWHACAYCYARPTHEYLGFGAGTDFDRKITVKPEAPRLLRERFERRSWKGDLVAFSGVTDCYQPLEASYELTRRCLEVCIEYRNPAGVITKSPLIERDIDLLVELGRVASCGVSVSIPMWNEGHARALEPGVSSPKRRIETIRRLAAAGIQVGVNVAPLIPGLGDEDLVRILEAAASAGAKHAGLVILRLPGSVRPVFLERLERDLPLRAAKVVSLIQEVRGGAMNDPRFGKRQRGEGPYAKTIEALFVATTRRLGLNREPWREPAETFSRPSQRQQLTLFR
jgi:DNA repair photolyase